MELVEFHLFMQKIHPTIEGEHLNALLTLIGISRDICVQKTKHSTFFMVGSECRDVGVQRKAMIYFYFS